MKRALRGSGKSSNATYNVMHVHRADAIAFAAKQRKTLYGGRRLIPVDESTFLTSRAYGSEPFRNVSPLLSAMA